MSNWSFYTDAGPVRAHVHMLREYGIGAKQVAKIANVSIGVVNTLNQGNFSKRGVMTKKVTTGAAMRIMAVKPILANVADGASVDSRTTRRQMEALAAVGYSFGWIATQIGMKRSSIYLTYEAPRVLGRTARAIEALFNQYAYTRRVSNEVHIRKSISRTLAQAKRYGWVPAAAWDDIERDEYPADKTG